MSGTPALTFVCTSGNLIQKTDRNERVTIYEQDNLGRMIADGLCVGTRPVPPIARYFFSRVPVMSNSVFWPPRSEVPLPLSLSPSRVNL